MYNIIEFIRKASPQVFALILLGVALTTSAIVLTILRFIPLGG